jgi:hypothetical protein
MRRSTKKSLQFSVSGGSEYVCGRGSLEAENPVFGLLWFKKEVMEVWVR